VKWLLIFPAVLVVVFGWNALLAVVLRPWVRLPFFLFSKPKESKKSLRELPPRVRALVAGVFQWGWGCFLAITLWNYLTWRYFADASMKPTVRGLAVQFAIWSVAGFFFRYEGQGPVYGKYEKEI